jgi:hypothetical protein
MLRSRQKVIIEKPEEEDTIYFVTSDAVNKPSDETTVNVKRIGVVWDASKSRHDNPNVELEYKTLTQIGRKVSFYFLVITVLTLRSSLALLICCRSATQATSPKKLNLSALSIN